MTARLYSHDLLRLIGLSSLPPEIPNFPVSSVVQDSRRAQKDSIFVAVKGSKADGAQFVADALERGARLVLSEESLKAPAEIHVENARRAYAVLNHFLYGAPSERLKVVGITGTNGKTTTAYLVREIFKDDLRMGLIGTVRYEFAGESLEASHTTPDAAELQALFERMLEAGCGGVVMEASSHALDQERLAGTRFDAAVFTNLTRDHLDYHGTMERYFEAKARLFTLIKAQGVAVINADDPWAARLRATLKNVLTFSVRGEADLSASEIRSDLEGSRFNLNAKGKKIPVRTPLIGEHNVSNILAALGAAWALGLDPAAAAVRIQNFGGAPGRLERVNAGQNFHLFVDYAHTDDGLTNVLGALRPLTKRSLLVLFGCGGNRDRGKRPKMASATEKFADFIVLTSDNPRHEDPKAIAQEAALGFSSEFKSYEIQLDRKKAIRRVLLQARQGDVVLLAGKGHEDVQVVGDEKVPFSDREEALRVLKGR